MSTAYFFPYLLDPIHQHQLPSVSSTPCSNQSIPYFSPCHSLALDINKYAATAKELCWIEYSQADSASTLDGNSVLRSSPLLSHSDPCTQFSPSLRPPDVGPQGSLTGLDEYHGESQMIGSHQVNMTDKGKKRALSDGDYTTTSNSRPRKKRRLTEIGDAQFHCQICGKYFSRIWNYNAHLATHDPQRQKPHVCQASGCGKAFVRRTDLTRHQQCVHAKDKKFRCQFCNKKFARKDTLRRHEEDGCSKRVDIASRKSKGRNTQWTTTTKVLRFLPPPEYVSRDTPPSSLPNTTYDDHPQHQEHYSQQIQQDYQYLEQPQLPPPRSDVLPSRHEYLNNANYNHIGMNAQQCQQGIPGFLQSCAC